MRRVVVTGLGIVSPLGCGIEPTWKRILSSESGAKKIDTFDVSDLTSRIACVIPRGDGTDGTFNPDHWMEPKDQRKVDDFIIFAMCAARQALDDANWHPSTEEDRCATGTMIGSGIGGLSGIADAAVLVKERGPRRLSPFFIPGRLINLASGYVSIEHGLKGPNHAVVTACSTGAHAIGDASRLIALGDADVMLAGGTESPISRLAMAGFCAMRALSTNFNDAPPKASRPYDRDRDGFVMGEGAGIVVLEEYEHAKARGAKMYAEIVGYGMSGDAYHITAPTPDGDGAYRCMSLAMKRAGIAASDLDYINAHGTSTPLGDEIELGAVQRLLGNAAPMVSMSSTKSSTGHLLGAAGAVEAIFCILAIRDNIAPPTINLDNPSVETAIDLVRKSRGNARLMLHCRIRLGLGEPTLRWFYNVWLTKGVHEGFPCFASIQCISPGPTYGIDPCGILAGFDQFNRIQVASMSERPSISPRSPRAALEPEQVPPPPKRSERARNPFVVVGNAIITLLLVAMIATGGIYVYGKQQIEAPGPLLEDKIVNIPPKSRQGDIADTLLREGVIDVNRWVFMAGAFALKASSELKPGEYAFQKNGQPARCDRHDRGRQGGAARRDDSGGAYL